jgi:hypothetical protein
VAEAQASPLLAAGTKHIGLKEHPMLFMFSAALFDPLMLGASLVATVLFARRWLHVFGVGVAVGLLGETC